MLVSIGFEPDPSTPSDPPGALKKRFGSLELSAIHCIGPRFSPIVKLGGVLGTTRSITEVSFEMPQQVDSAEQGMAWMAWHLDNQLGARSPALEHELWLETARASVHLLPWVQQTKAYESRPMCRIPKELAKPAFHRLSEYLVNVPDDANARLRFDGGAFSVRVAEHLTILPAEGTPWESEYVIPAVRLQELPRRWANRPVVIDVWEGDLRIGNRVYRGVEPVGP